MTVDISVVTETGLTLLFVIFVGFLANKTGFLDAKFSKRLSTFTVCIAQPCMLFTSITRVAYSKQNVKTGMWLLLLTIGVHALMAGMAYLFTRFFRDTEERKITQFSLIFVNVAFVGYPILQAVFGDVGRFWGAFWVMMFNIIIWTYGIFLLLRGRQTQIFNWKKIVFNYGTVPCVLGLIFYVLHLSLPSFLMNGLTYVGDISTPLALIIIGSNLAQIAPRVIFCNPKTYYFAALRLLVFPLAVALVCRLIGISETFCLFAAVMASLPTAANTVMFAEMYDLRPDLAARTVGVSAVLSMLSIPLVVYLAGNLIKICPSIL